MTRIQAPGVPGAEPAEVYLQRLAAGSRASVASALRAAVAVLSGGAARVEGFVWASVSYADTARLRAGLVKRYSPATCNRVLSAVRGVLREAWRLELMHWDTYRRAASVENVRLSGLVRGRALGVHEVERLARACLNDDSPAGARDAAAVALMYGGGLRRREVVELDVSDFNATRGSVTVRAGKGGRLRVAFIGGGGVGVVDAWLDKRGRYPGPLLVKVNRAGKVLRHRLTPSALWWMLQRRARKADIDALSPHDLRRSFVTLALDQGADLGAVQRLAGHAHVNTTLRYDRRDERVRCKAAGLLPTVFVEHETAADDRLRLLGQGHVV